MSRSIWVLAALILVALGAPHLGDTWFRPVEKLATEWARKKRAVVIALGLLAIVARVALLPVFPVPAPEVHDEFSYLVAGDTFAHGRLTNPPHPMSLFLDTFHVLQQPTYASIYPPAQGVFLAFGEILHLPWLGVLLSIGLMCSAVTWMLQAWFPPAWAMLGGILLLLRFALFSYWVNSYWGGAVAAIGGALVLGAFRRIIHHYRSRDAIVLGIGAGILANSRPLEGFVFCIPVAVALLAWLVSQKTPDLTLVARRVLLPLASVMMLTLIFMGYYNWRVTGNALLLPHALELTQQCNCKLLPWEKPYPPLHYTNPQFDYFYNTHLRARYAPTWQAWKHRSWQTIRAWWHFFLGSMLSIPFVTLPWIVRDRRVRLLNVQLCCSALGLMLAIFFEPHYAAPLIATVFALLVQAMRHLRQWRLWGRPVGVSVTRLIVLAALANVPFFIWSTVRQGPPVESWNLARLRFERQLESIPGRHLVVVRYAKNHAVGDEWVYNRANIDDSKVVWAREIPGQNLQPLLDYFRQRQVWIVEADTSPPRLEPFISALAQVN